MRDHLSERVIRNGAVVGFVLSVVGVVGLAGVELPLGTNWHLLWVAGTVAGLYAGAASGRHGDPLRLGMLVGVYGGAGFTVVQTGRSVVGSSLQEAILGTAGGFWGLAVLVTMGLVGAYVGDSLLSHRVGERDASTE
jgi:hypothetical protein